MEDLELVNAEAMGGKNLWTQKRSTYKVKDLVLVKVGRIRKQATPVWAGKIVQISRNLEDVTSSF